jgi:hypothetical protein
MSFELALRSDLSIPELEAIGFRIGDKGTHTSRTIMLAELSSLLSECPGDASREDYARAIITENCLGKRTEATRRLTNQRLGELYSLDSSTPLFRILRQYWIVDENARPLLALLLALARDPLLRVTATTVLRLPQGHDLSRREMTEQLTEATRGRFNESTLDKIIRNANSSWEQSGHLSGRVRKIRIRTVPNPVSVAYALFLGYTLGYRDRALLTSEWISVFDAGEVEILETASQARRLGLLDMSSAGDILSISFNRFLTDNELRVIHGTNRRPE